MNLARNLKVECVSRLSASVPALLDHTRTIAEAVELMRDRQVGSLLVCHCGVLVGIFTERDLLTRVLATGTPLSATIGSVMTPSPVTISPHDPINLALRRMQDGRYRHLPIVDEWHRPQGILSVKQIVRYLVEHFPASVYNLPPDPHAVPHQREGA